MLKIKIPATTANIGPGFDCLGMALNMHLSIEVYKNTDETSFIWNNLIEEVPLEKNMIYNTIKKILKLKNSESYFKVVVDKNEIPISRGLGSSASAIVAGVYAANYILDNILTENEMLDIACEIEGHPDNVVPAIKGGFQISKKLNGKYITSSVNVPENLKLVIYSPDFTINTEEARAILPDKYEKKDVFENLSNLALLVNSFNNNNDYENIKYALSDIIHQPFRVNLINNGKEILNHSNEIGSLGEFISGSGPTLISLITDDDKFIENMKSFLSKYNDNWNCSVTTINRRGVEIEVIDE